MFFSRLQTCLEPIQSITLTARRIGSGDLFIAALPHFPPMPHSRAAAARQERERFAEAQTPLILAGPADSIESRLADALEGLINERAARYRAALAAIREIEETEHALGATPSSQRPSSDPGADEEGEHADETEIDDEPVEEEDSIAPGEGSARGGPPAPADPGILPLFPNEP